MDEFTAQTLRLALPLVLATLSEVVCERGGVVNLGIEGMMLVGALTAALVAGSTGNVAFGASAAMLAGAVVASLSAWFIVGRGADMIVTGTAIHLLCIGGTAWVHDRWSAQVDTFTPRTGVAGAWPYAVTLLAVVALGWFLHHTGPGLRLRAAGEAPDALRAAGGSPRRSRVLALILAGGLAGLAGATLTTVLTGHFVPEMTDGRGFLALSLVLFARWSPWGALVAGIFLGATFALELQLAVRIADDVGGATHDAWSFGLRVLPYVVTLLALALVGMHRVRAPAALGQDLSGAAR